ncbi:hypothetical protein ELLBI42_02260 [Enterobacter ludwigii]|nr:hypothetical protein ELLBI42_02260 [Enterobacter ludwigii]QDE48580.1 hypothetical protein ECI140_02260 [Enterobacter ludwigii]
MLSGHKKTLSTSHICTPAHNLFRSHAPLIAVRWRDIHHVNTVIYLYSAYLCGTDHCRCSPFHFEVENNSLQTIPPQR